MWYGANTWHRWGAVRAGEGVVVVDAVFVGARVTVVQDGRAWVSGVVESVGAWGVRLRRDDTGMPDWFGLAHPGRVFQL